MKASNGKDATPAQYLEYLRQKKGIWHARHMRDALGWRWRPSAMAWTIRHAAPSWFVRACIFATGVVEVANNLKGLFG